MRYHIPDCLVGPQRNDRAVTNYTYRAEWCPEYLEYVGRCLEFPAYVARARTAHQAIAGIEALVDEALAEYEEDGATPPASLTDRRYSGQFVVRTSPALHARLSVEAMEQRVSLNQWVVQKLSGRAVTNPLDGLF